MDKGYAGLVGLLTPAKRKPGMKLIKAVKDNNRVRAVGERAIAQVKTWRVLHSGFRRPLGSYQQVFEGGPRLVFFAAGKGF